MLKQANFHHSFAMYHQRLLSFAQGKYDLCNNRNRPRPLMYVCRQWRASVSSVSLSHHMYSKTNSSITSATDTGKTLPCLPHCIYATTTRDAGNIQQYRPDEAGRGSKQAFNYWYLSAWHELYDLLTNGSCLWSELWHGQQDSGVLIIQISRESLHLGKIESRVTNKMGLICLTQ